MYSYLWSVVIKPKSNTNSRINHYERIVLNTHSNCQIFGWWTVSSSSGTTTTTTATTTAAAVAASANNNNKWWRWW